MTILRPFARACRATIAFVLASAGTSRVAAAQTHTGWTYAVKLTIDSGGTSKPVTSTVTEYITDAKLRVDIGKSSNAPTTPQPGIGGPSYVLLDDADSTMTSVIPESHMAMIIGLSAFSMMNDMGISVSVDTQPKFVDLGPGETLLGHSTRHYSNKATVSVTMGKICTMTQLATTETWVAPDIDFRAVELQINKRMGPLGHLTSDVLRQSGAGTGTWPAGTALRTITKATDADHPGRVITTRTDVLDVHQGPVPDSLFVLPDSIHSTDMRAMMSGMAEATKGQAMAVAIAQCEKMKGH